jgi:hypothetical protein
MAHAGTAASRTPHLAEPLAAQQSPGLIAGHVLSADCRVRLQVRGKRIDDNATDRHGAVARPHRQPPHHASAARIAVHLTFSAQRPA